VRDIEEQEKAINMYFHEGKSLRSIAREMGLPLPTIMTWCYRYRKANNIPTRDKAELTKEAIFKERQHIEKPRKGATTEARIAQLEMEVELLRNFLILTEKE